MPPREIVRRPKLSRWGLYKRTDQHETGSSINIRKSFFIDFFHAVVTRYVAIGVKIERQTD